MSTYLELLLLFAAFYIVLNFFAIPTERYDEEDTICLPRAAALLLFPPLAIGRLKSYLTFAVPLQAGVLINVIGAGVCAALTHFGVGIPALVPKILFGLFFIFMAVGIIFAFIVWYRKSHVRYEAERRRRRRRF